MSRLPPREPKSQWRVLGAICTFLLIAFASVAWVQTRTQALLEESVADRTDSLTFAFGQLENEFLRLCELMRREAMVPGSVDPAALSMRYEIFVSRVMQAGGDGANLFARIGHAKDPTQKELRDFVAAADPLIGENAKGVPPADVMLALTDRLDQLGPRVHDLALDAYHRDAQAAGLRDDAVQLQNRIAVGLTLFQSLLTMVFAFVVIRQLRTAEVRRVNLERLADELGRAQAAAEAASRSKSAFVANMSHELRTPFHGLLGMMTLVEHGPLTTDQHRHLRTARRSGEHLLSILNDVLDISKLDSGGVDIEPRDVELARVLGEVVALMRPQALERRLRLEIEQVDELPDRLVIDAKRLKQILFNLIGNAIKFTKRGRVRLVVSWLPHADLAALVGGAMTSAVIRDSANPRLQRGVLSVRVIDDGIGMDAATMERLFQRFAQGDESIQRRFGGTGLGLEISRTLARRMGGDITVRSELGKGSEFRLLLPAEPGFAPTEPGDDLGSSYSQPADLAGATHPADLAPASELQEPRRATINAAPAPRLSAAGLHALVCDDNEVNRMLMQAFLQRFGCEPVMCEDGAQAVALMRCNRFDFVLMDVHMPVLDGFAATREIRSQQLGGEDGPVIVAVTADPLNETREQALQAGIDDLLAKPMDLDDIEACLRRHFPHLFEAA